MKIRISDTYCTWEFELSGESRKYSIREIITNAIQKRPGKPSMTIKSETLINVGVS